MCMICQCVCTCELSQNVVLGWKNNFHTFYEGSLVSFTCATVYIIIIICTVLLAMTKLSDTFSFVSFLDMRSVELAAYTARDPLSV